MSKEIEVTVDASSQQAEALVGNLKSVPAKWSKWDAGTTYTPLRSVSHNGSGYVCRKACTGVDPETDVLAGDGVEGEYWILTAKRGKSAYEIAVENGFEGTEADYYEKLEMVPLQASAAAVNANVAEDAAKNASASANSANNFSTIAEQFSARAVEAFTGAVDANAAAQTAKTQAVNAQSGAETARELAESYTNHPPVPGDNGNWQVWDGEKYVDSGKQAVAKDGDAIIDVDALPETDIDETVLYRLTTDNNDLYQYKKRWIRANGVGRRGAGSSAEIFNDLATNTATGRFGHAEGRLTTANGICSHAEGQGTIAGGQCGHAEGTYTHANAPDSHSEGAYTNADGRASHAEGVYTDANGRASHTEGSFTVADGTNQHVQGRYNIPDSDEKYSHIVGNGESEEKRSNAHTIDWAGLGWFAGGLKVGGTGQDDESAKDVVAADAITAADNGKFLRVVDGAWAAVLLTDVSEVGM